MKVLLMLMLLGLGAATLVVAEEAEMCDDFITALCPPEDVGMPVFLPVPENCREYCECSDGIAWLFECAAGTLFDSDKLTCDWETNVDCHGRPTPSTTDFFEIVDSSEEDENDSW